MASPPSGPPPTSPRSNLSRLLSVTLGAEATQSQQDLQQQMDILMQADAENKVRNRKLYLILDLDETLVYSQRMKPGAVPLGHPSERLPRARGWRVGVLPAALVVRLAPESARTAVYTLRCGPAPPARRSANIGPRSHLERNLPTGSGEP